jgi:flagellar biogenesis protein FliO
MKRGLPGKSNAAEIGFLAFGIGALIGLIGFGVWAIVKIGQNVGPLGDSITNG